MTDTNTKTETGKLMSSSRMREFSTEPGYINFIGTEEEYQLYLKMLQKQVEINESSLETQELLLSRIERLEGVVGNLTQQYAQLLSIWIALHPSEASQALKVHPDNLANHLALDHEL